MPAYIASTTLVFWPAWWCGFRVVGERNSGGEFAGAIFELELCLCHLTPSHPRPRARQLEVRLLVIDEIHSLFAGT
jgi:hypothetical protein